MEITEVRIKLMEDGSERLQAFCSITFDNCFVIRDLKIIEGAQGPFVAMPSRKLTAHCPQCRSKNHLRAAYCNHCGRCLKDEVTIKEQDGRAKLYADVAHPINSACREMIQKRVIDEFQAEQGRAKQPGYVSRYDETYQDDGDDVHLEESHPLDGQAAGGHQGHQKVQPAEPTPRGPHSRSSSRRRGAAPKKQGQFGDGIF